MSWKIHENTTDFFWADLGRIAMTKRKPPCVKNYQRLIIATLAPEGRCSSKTCGGEPCLSHVSDSFHDGMTVTIHDLTGMHTH